MKRIFDKIMPAVMPNNKYQKQWRQFSSGIYWVAQKWHSFLYALTSSNKNRFSKLFHCQNQEKIYNNTITKDPTTPQVCRYTTL